MVERHNLARFAFENHDDVVAEGGFHNIGERVRLEAEGCARKCLHHAAIASKETNISTLGLARAGGKIARRCRENFIERFGASLLLSQLVWATRIFRDLLHQLLIDLQLRCLGQGHCLLAFFSRGSRAKENMAGAHGAAIEQCLVRIEKRFQRLVGTLLGHELFPADFCCHVNQQFIGGEAHAFENLVEFTILFFSFCFHLFNTLRHLFRRGGYACLKQVLVYQHGVDQELKQFATNFSMPGRGEPLKAPLHCRLENILPVHTCHNGVWWQLSCTCQCHRRRWRNWNRTGCHRYLHKSQPASHCGIHQHQHGLVSSVWLNRRAPYAGPAVR